MDKSSVVIRDVESSGRLSEVATILAAVILRLRRSSDLSKRNSTLPGLEVSDETVLSVTTG